MTLRLPGLVFAALAIGAGLCGATTPAPDAPPPLPSVMQWHETPSGLKYADLAVGQGPTPREGQVVVVHFTGWLKDGTKFDSTHDRGRPFGFPVGSGQVIKAWDEVVRTMRAGGKRRLITPPSLAYGAKGFPPIIPADATLTFDIEVLRIIEQPPPGQRPGTRRQ
jgi:peptidylprolyl isomerase